MADLWESIRTQFYRSFIHDDRWTFIVEGLGNTLLITLFSLLLGSAIGILISAIRTSWDRTSITMTPGPVKLVLRLLNSFSKIYLTVIRGTPVMLQLMIIFFIILQTTNKILVAIIALGINSGAYVAEIMRSGIQAVDPGQFEAGRSLGFNYIKTMWYIVLPQAFKNILPALCNEFIVLFKETAIAGVVGVTDLTRAANIIRGVTFQGIFPLFSVALIYLLFVMFFTMLVGKLERRLKSSER
jgi:His/Glu/Gln/Arg/opine family amino acid ABC transporter permease subunit